MACLFLPPLIPRLLKQNSSYGRHRMMSGGLMVLASRVWVASVALAPWVLIVLWLWTDGGILSCFCLWFDLERPARSYFNEWVRGRKCFMGSAAWFDSEIWGRFWAETEKNPIEITLLGYSWSVLHYVKKHVGYKYLKYKDTYFIYCLCLSCWQLYSTSVCMCTAGNPKVWTCTHNKAINWSIVQLDLVIK